MIVVPGLSFESVYITLQLSCRLSHILIKLSIDLVDRLGECFIIFQDGNRGYLAMSSSSSNMKQIVLAYKLPTAQS